MGQPQFAFVFSHSSQFVPVGSGYCTPDLAMFDTGDGDVSFAGTQSPDSPKTLPLPPGGSGAKTQSVLLMESATATINVQKGKKPSFSFAACDGDGDYQAYVLAGVALQNANGDGTGVGAFPTLGVEVKSGATMMTLSDDNKDNATYEFYVLVQNAEGKLGLIDPRIVNQS